ncbi:Transposase [Burkholderia sp. WP9]|uniref:transposase n=1 Tax=Burkholderia sp. WP9 TaxID=1500263 RepID=UPI00089CB2D6|nr:transposase [Burkholderia sp. WP9]SEF12468.1 Transposase [Burkholderia sp. WP9]
MPFPATRIALSHVGCAGDPRSGAAACADAQIGGVLWRRQLEHWPLRLAGVPCLFASFLRQLLRHRRRGKRIVVVLDNARYHHAILLKPLLRKYRCHLTLLFIPPYSPQLAPIERVRKLTWRLSLHNRYFATLAEVILAVDACFRQWKRPNEVLRRLCCII